MRVEEGQRNLRQPFMIVPRQAGCAVGIGIEARDMAGAKNRLPGQHVYPEVRVGEVVSRRDRDRKDYRPSRL